MAALLFPDNTVLVNFALLDRLSLLDELVRGKAAWTATVANECDASAQRPGLADLARCAEIFGEPWRLTSPSEIVDAQSIRARMASPGESQSAHLGEAEALVIISGRSPRSAFVTDDLGARVVAQSMGVATYSTCHLLKLAVRGRRLSAQDAWQDVLSLRRQRRRLLDSPGEEWTYMEWCAA